MQALVQSVLEVFLLLTSAQNDEMDRNEALLTSWQLPKYERQNAVAIEISGEKAKDSIDSIALGLRYAEIETIRREIAEREAATLAANRQLLTETQRSRLRTLAEASSLLPTIREAECRRLLAATANCVVRNVNRPIVVGLAGSGIEATAIEEFLLLTPDQRVAYRANIDGYNRWHTAQHESISEWQRTACIALAASPLEPAAIGSPFSSIAVTERQIDGRRAALIQANHALLTPVQRARLQLLVEARALTGPIQEAEGGGFLQPLEAERGGFLQPFNGISTSRFRWFDTTAFNVLDPCRP